MVSKHPSRTAISSSRGEECTSRVQYSGQLPVSVWHIARPSGYATATPRRTNLVIHVRRPHELPCPFLGLPVASYRRSPLQGANVRPEAVAPWYLAGGSSNRWCYFLPNSDGFPAANARDAAVGRPLQVARVSTLSER